MANSNARNEKKNDTLASQSFLLDLPAYAYCVADPTGTGFLISFVAPAVADQKDAHLKARHVFAAGRLDQLTGFTCCYRYDPYWMTPCAGTELKNVPPETQYLLSQRSDGLCVLVVPLLDGGFRCALQGTPLGTLELVAESNDPAVVTDRVVGLFVAAGPDPYELLERSARAVCAHLKLGRLRHDKPDPEFMDYFGWCTWDAFYSEVSAEKVKIGLQSFKAAGLEPRLLILDDGWQSVATGFPAGSARLSSFVANDKFPGDLAPLVTLSKTEFRIKEFFVWHAVMGYWGGVDAASLPEYDVRSMPRQFAPGILHHAPEIVRSADRVVGAVPPEQAYRFYQDYHRHLRLQGVDGVKIDNQCSLEGLAAGHGGRTNMYRHYRQAMEGSIQTHFGAAGELINCMSCSTEVFYGQLASNVTRTSTDFWPNRPESHGLHLYTNAQVCAWFGHFTWGDWDMFQSTHAAGAFHAAGRAVSGAPVYVSDKPDAHDFKLLRKMVLADGMVLRAEHPGMPTRDCLFADPTKEDVLLKIFNHNSHGGVVGVFNARYNPEQPEAAIAGSLRPADVEELAGERFAVWAHNAQTLTVMRHHDELPLSLKPLEFEVFTIVPIEAGLAPIGLADMFNSGGAVLYHYIDPDATTHGLGIRSGGAAANFRAWSEKKPKRVLVEGDPTAFTFDKSSGVLRLKLPAGLEVCHVTVMY
ncbi:MAG: Sip1-related alpha-galactosidase [Phycisphaerae bacterium]